MTPRVATIYNCEHMTGHRGCIWHERNWSKDITPRRCPGCPNSVSDGNPKGEDAQAAESERCQRGPEGETPHLLSPITEKAE